MRKTRAVRSLWLGVTIVEGGVTGEMGRYETGEVGENVGS